MTATPFAKLPEATSSFGAVVIDGWLYVYGCHIAPTHSYSTEAVSGRFSPLKLGSNGAQREQLPSGPGLQGMNLAAYKGKIYLVGGMAPRNKPGSPADTHSVADCARFDPDSMKWESLPPLPVPRSSHDVVVIGDKLIVVGRWTLKGVEPTEWLETTAALGLGRVHVEDVARHKPVEEHTQRGEVLLDGGRGKLPLQVFDEHKRS